MNAAAIFIAAVAVVLIAVLIKAVKIVRPFQQGLVERLGRYKTTKQPGFNLILPFIERIQLIDMREQVVDVPPQEVITKDNVVVSVDAVVFYEATDPQRLVYNVVDFFVGITKLAQTNLRNLIGDLELDKALTSRDTINTQLREVLDNATDKWGVRVVRVEIQRIDPPSSMVDGLMGLVRHPPSFTSVAARMTSSRLYAVTMITVGGRPSASSVPSARAVSTPSIPGMRQSMNTIW